MRFERLDLNLLVALDALIEERSVSTAARRLFLSQPAVSGALNRLREYFGDELLVPSGRQMILTPKAEELREPVRESLNFIRARITTPGEFDPATAEREFKIVTSDYAYHVIVSEVIRQAAKLAPGVTFELAPTDRMASEQLERGEVDLFLTISSHMDKTHPQEILFDDEHAVIAWSEGKYGKTLTAEDFLEAGHVVVYFGPERYPAFTETYFVQQGIDRRIELRLPTFAGLPESVIGTNRLATMYRRHARYFEKSLPITIHESPLPLPRIVEQIQWHSIRDNDKGLKWLLGLFLQQAAKLTSGPAANQTEGL